jgi:hypothetical protein
MGFLDRFKRLSRQAEDLVEEHDDKILDGIDKAADFADDKTKGKHSDKIDKGAAKAKEQVRKLAKEE